VNKNVIGARLLSDQEKIIEMYKGEVGISDIADEYNIMASTLRIKLRKWGVKVRRGDYKAKKKEEQVFVHFKHRISPELLAKIEENTRINDDKIQYVSFLRGTEDQYLVSNIINHPIIG